MRRVTISVPDELADAVVAKADGRPVSAVVRRAIAAWLEGGEPVGDWRILQDWAGTWAVRPKPGDPRVTERIRLNDAAPFLPYVEPQLHSTEIR